jgi:hypothetical protein
MMQSLDPHTLFSIFEQGDEQVYKEHGIQDVLSNPFVLIGMVVTGVQNYHIMDLMYMRQYPSQYKQVRHITKKKYFDNLYKYLLRVDVQETQELYKVGESFDTKEATYSLNVLINFYEELELYEKCAVIKKFIDILK